MTVDLAAQEQVRYGVLVILPFDKEGGTKQHQVRISMPW